MQQKHYSVANKRRINIANFINIYKIYVPMLYVTRMTQNKNDSIN